MTLTFLKASFATWVIAAQPFTGIASHANPCEREWGEVLRPKINEAPPHLEFSDKTVAELAQEFASPDTLFVTDSHNFNSTSKIGRTALVQDNEMSTVDGIRAQSFKRVIAVGGCTALDVAKVAAGSAEVIIIPTLLSTACISVNKGIIRVNGKSQAIKTGVASRVIVPIQELLKTPPAIQSQWSRSGFADCLARVSASVDYQYKRGLPLDAPGIQANVQETIQGMNWINQEFKTYDAPALRRLAELSHQASSSSIIRGDSELSAGGEHKFYYYLVENIPKERLPATHGEIVGIGSLIALRALAEKTHDFTLYRSFYESLKKLDVPLTYERLNAVGMTRDAMISGLKGIRPSGTYLSDAFKSGDFSVMDRIFGENQSKAPAISLAHAPEKAIMGFGGSFDPPTQAHLKMVANVMTQEGISHALIIPTRPYKGTGEATGVNLHLTQLAVHDFERVLNDAHIPHWNFRQIGPGKVSWIGANGKEFQVEVSDIDYKNNVSANTAETLRHLRDEAGGDARDVFWLSGSDSFESTLEAQQKRGPGNVEKVIAGANWLVIPRGGSPDLRQMSEQVRKDFLGPLTAAPYKSSAGEDKFVLQNSEIPPAIIFLNETPIDQSSSEARQRIRAGQTTLGDILLPSVDREISEKSYYLNP